ncbi:hypothetical protein SLE2022_147430 [Rubroshorea leprosula]
MAGRRVLVQSVTSAIPTYTMQSILLPDYVCAAIDRLNRNFLWGSDVANRPHLVNWHSVCLPRTQGGLGIRSAKDNNRALIAKLGWQLLSNPEKPWCRAFIQKYLQRGSFMSCNINSTSSVTWKSILRCRDVLRLGLRWRVGTGEKIRFWQDAWVSDRPLLDVALLPALEDQIDIPVSHVIKPDRTWDFQVLQQLLPELVVEQISALPLPSFGHQEDGIFERHFASSPMCPRCEQDQETPLHLLRDCYYSRLVWESTPLPANFFNLDLDGWLYQNATSTSSTGESHQLWSMLFLALLWEGNFAADYMAAIGQNLSHGVTMFPEPPVGIASILNRDAVGTLFPRF